MSELKNFKVDAQTIIHLGRGSIKDHTTALVELIKNCYDADASHVEVEVVVNVPEPYIRIADNGHGMTEDIVDNQWLRIGFSDKTVKKISSKYLRRRVGEKGIGRISADRLGSILELYTKAEGEVPFGLMVNWDDFNVQGKSIDEIQLHTIPVTSFRVPYRASENQDFSGTELIIKNLRQTWALSDLVILSRELSVLFSPFSEINDFHFDILTDIEGFEFERESHINQNYAIKLDLVFESNSFRYEYLLDDKVSGKIAMVEGEVYELLTGSNYKSYDFNFGNVIITLIFYPQSRNLIDSDFSLRDMRSFLQNNSGIGIYRDRVRVKPYGLRDTVEWDWLNLGQRFARNPASAGRTSFRIGPHQLVGAIFVSRDENPKLVDSSSREGLIDSPAFMALRELVIACVRVVETRYHTVFVSSAEMDVLHPSDNVREFGKSLRLFQDDIRRVQQSIPSDVARVIDFDKVFEDSERARAAIEELASQATIYRGLATIGIAASVFSHETQLALGSLMGAAKNSREFLSDDHLDIEAAADSLDEAIIFANHITAWGSFVLDRVRRDKRKKRKINLRVLIHDIARRLNPLMENVNIEFYYDDVEDIETRTFAMDIEAAVVNLLTNAYTACKERLNKRVVKIQCKHSIENGQRGFEIIVSDSGYGVKLDFRERIWQALFTTKSGKSDDDSRQQTGTGLGLSIVDSIVKELGGKRFVDQDTELHGASFRLWFPIG